MTQMPSSFPRTAGFAASLTVFALLALAACGGEDGTGARADAVVRDSAGIRIVESPLTGLPVRSAAATPELTVGSLDGEEGIYRLVALDRRSDGSWVTANAGSSEIRIFSPSGELVQVVGRQGDGPGEFRRLSGVVVLPGDSLFATDGQARRGTFFTPAGDPVRTVTGTGEARFVPLRPLGNGNLAASGLSRFGGGEMRSQTVIRPDSPLGILDSEGQLAADLGTLPGSERWFWQDATSVSIRSLPFGRSDAVAASAERVFAGITDEPEVTTWGADGDLLGIWRWDHQPPPVTEDEIARIQAEEFAEIEDPGYRRQTEALYESAAFPEYHPAWERLLVSSEGHLWIQQFHPPASDAPVRWWRTGRDGAIQEVVELPAGFQLHWASLDLVAGRVTDELDVEYLQVFRLEE